MRANDVADVIIEQLGSAPTSMQLQKLLYYSQAWHLAITGHPLFDEECQAWENGPVVYEVWRERRPFSSRVPRGRTDVRLTKTAAGIVELVCAAYGSMSGDQLSALTHEEAPWSEARAGVPAHHGSNKAISRASMATFYREHRRLGGRTAEDLAAAGVFVASPRVANDDFDIDALLGELDPTLQASIPLDQIKVNAEALPPELSFDGIVTTRVDLRDADDC
ncbi:Panacea domain-containing protein [Nocardioides sp. J54]|uniref:Panacea domain-containing protein n=1 Tax=Nocardioides sp. J54 TaxID=935866 RepID=UPI0018DE5C4E|nr:type II toxin-antitoxin system antitoxin SocA domain-containing protein [Nocardioides sp. J54]